MLYITVKGLLPLVKAISISLSGESYFHSQSGEAIRYSVKSGNASQAFRYAHMAWSFSIIVLMEPSWESSGPLPDSLLENIKRVQFIGDFFSS